MKKTCSNPGCLEPIKDVEAFYRTAQGVFMGRCKICDNAISKLYREANKERISEQKRKYRQKNKESISGSKRIHYQANKEVIAEKGREYRANNKDKVVERNRRYNKENKESVAAKSKIYRANNIQSICEQKKKWVQNNPGKKRASGARRDAAKLDRTVVWGDDWKIKQYYIMAKKLTNLYGIIFHVDHIIPLQGKLVSGFHVHNNLQIITATENVTKSNKLSMRGRIQIRC